MKLEIMVVTVLLVAIVLIGAGALGLAFESFTLIGGSYPADPGLAGLSTNATAHSHAPVLAGVFTVVAGGVLLVWH